MSFVSLARRYEIVRHLSTGGMAEVFLAKQRGIDGFEKLVVIKQIRSDLAGDSNFVRMFLDEARTAADLRHPNVVTVFEVGIENDDYFLVMEYLDGRSLHQIQAHLQDTQQKLPEAIGVQCVIEAANALHYAHLKRDLYGRELHIVHRDVSPHNIVVTFEGQTKLVDFGVARAARGAEVDSAMLFGKLPYMSPEQARGKPLTAASDQFSLGVVLYELTTGVRAFERETDAATVEAVRNVQLPAPSEARADYPRTLEALVMRALSSEPGDRFASCGELAEALEDYLAQTGAGYSPRRLREFMRDTFSADQVGEIESTDDLDLTVPGFGEAFTAAPAFLRVTNLGVRATSFIGRHRELQEVDEQFLKGRRLVTLLGPAGVGKTRLASYYGTLHTEDYATQGGVWAFDLTDMRSPAEICAAIADPLGIRLSPGADPVEQLAQALPGRGATLLLLDNFEHLVAHANALIAPLLQRAQHLRLLVTSREQLHVEGEVVYRLEPMGGPQRSDATTLFIERARDVRTRFEPDADERAAIEQLVERLDGLPLAIELAAARMSVFTPAEMLERIQSSLDLAARPNASTESRRHGTLRAAIRWSWELLDDEERSVLAQMSVFRGGFDLAAAEAVIETHDDSVLERVQALREKSLVQAWQPQKTSLRFGLLESIREFAAEQVGDAEALAARHAAHYTSVINPRAFGADARNRLAAERDNLMAVYESGMEGEATPTRAERALAAAYCLAPHLQVYGPHTLYDEVLHNALARAEEAAAHDTVDARLWRRVRLEQAIAWRDHGRATESAEMIDELVTAAHDAHDLELEARALEARASVEWAAGRMTDAMDAARAALELARQSQDEALQAHTLATCGNIDTDRGSLSTAKQYYEEALQLAKSSGDLRTQILLHLNGGNLALSHGNYDSARAELQQVFELNKEMGSPRLRAAGLGNWALLQQEEGRLTVANRVYREAVDGFLRIGNIRFAGVFGWLHTTALHEAGDLEAALARSEEVLGFLAEAGGDPRYEGATLTHQATMLAASGNLDDARDMLARGFKLLEDVGDTHQLAAAQIHEAIINVLAGAPQTLPEAAQPLLEESFEVRIAARLLGATQA